VNNPKLTIAVPVFNGGVQLLEAIESCKNISLPPTDFEVLIVDNCSTDEMINECVSKFGGTLPIRVIYNEFNCGRINNWNRCLQLAKGEIILFLFANDLISKNNSIKTALNLLEDNPNAALISAPWIISNLNQTFQKLGTEYRKRSPGIGIFKINEHITKVVEEGKLPFVCLQSCFLRKNLILEHGLIFDEKIPLTTDGVFLSSLALTTEIVGFIEKPTMIFRYDAPNRQHSNVKLDEHIAQMLGAFVQIQKLLKENEINLPRAFINFKGIEDGLSYISKNFSIDGFKYLLLMRKSWRNSVREYKIRGFSFRLRCLMRFLLLPANVLFYLTRTIVQKLNGSY
jgi:glycosyltransferase involved in cell wall biosynthesis